MSVVNAKQTIVNPTIPFSGNIVDGLHPGDIVLIQGMVLNDADRFHLDLACGSSTKPRSDVAFHLNPRFMSQPSIVCNSLVKECWGREEKLDQMPFKQGSMFETIILVHEDVFKVAVNGKHILEYRHRLPVETIDTFSISGRVSVHTIAFTPNSAIFSESGDLTIPYRGSMLRGLSPGQHITVTGHVSSYPHSFTVNLRSRSSENIALHLNARIKSGLFIRNSLLAQGWGREELELGHFPFAPGQYFEMIILCQPHQFKLAVNGDHLLDYRHRMQDLGSIDQLEVMGDLELQEVRLW
ncbi:galectin-8-like [Sardina pilchardus]|uniref:galectin-8-like n=1 Tax=Sardina pilchardus TaxID=27697 RepID=UPI002E133864